MDRPSGTVTFLFTDIEGSTRLWDEHPLIMRVALERHDALLRGAIDESGGFVFSTGGDGLAAAFARAEDAVRAAVAAQRVLRSEPWPDDAELRVRIGMHTGEAHERDGDYFGPPVNLAARIMSSASGGQVLVSAATASVVEPDVGVELSCLGHHQLRGFAESVQIFGVRADGLAWVELVRSSSNGNLPVASSSFVGRITDLQRRVADLRDHRLVTLTGPGGVGKTRLAIEVAALAAETVPDGTWLVELGPVTDPTAVVAAVAASLAVQPQPGMSLQDAVLDWLSRRQLLLVIDNCEHVLDAAAALVRAVTSKCPTISVLATSREPLGVSGEQVRIVPSLDSDGEAGQLFIDRALAADGSFDPGPEDLDAIRSICQRLDGIPLAIELAAARCRSLKPTEILGHLGDRFRLLRGSGRGGIERHETLRAAVTWSYRLLSDSERHLFDQLSVFVGTFDLTAAEAVCADDVLDALDVLDVLSGLVDRSMVQAVRDDGPTTRYRVLETLRQFGEEQLAESGDVGATRDRHLRWYVRRALALASQEVGPGEAAGGAGFGHEWDNLRAALGWAVDASDVEAAETLIAATSWHAFTRSLVEHEEWCDRTIALESADHPIGARVFAARAMWAQAKTDGEMQIAYARRGVEASGDGDATLCWFLIAMGELMGGHRVEADEAFVRAEAFGSHPDPAVRYWVLLGRAQIALSIDPRSAGPAVTAFVNGASEIGASSMISMAISFRAQMNIFGSDRPDIDSVLADADEALALARAVESSSGEGNAYNTIVMAHFRQGSMWTARAQLAEILAWQLDRRAWLFVVSALELLASALSRTPHVRCSGLVIGYLEEHRPAWAGTVAALRQFTLKTVRRHDDAELWLRQGAAMDRYALVDAVLAVLRLEE